MHPSFRDICKAALLPAFALGLLAPITASAAGLLYQPQFPDQQANYLPPAVLVGFNPQPEPPARLLITGDLADPNPSVVITGIEQDNIELLLGIGGGQQRLAHLVLIGQSCGLPRNTWLYPVFREVQIPRECRGSFTIAARFTDRTILNLDVVISASNGDKFIPPGNLVGFNPQPEPPAIPAFGLRVDLRESDSDAVSINLALSDRAGNPIALR
jgi:hypothetical protein